MTQPVERPLDPHAYEFFSRLPLNQEIDKKLLDMAPGRFESHTDLATGSGVQEEISGIARASQDLVTMFNAIHLTNPALALREAARIAKPGATLLVSSAYEKSANPDPAVRMLLTAMAIARRNLKAQGFRDFSRNESLSERPPLVTKFPDPCR